MNIFVDENIPKMTTQALRENGHDVKDIRGTTEEGIDDEEIWKIVKSENRLIITTDKGFALHRSELHSGILIVCLRQPNRLKIHQRVLHGLRQFSEHEWSGKILIMRDILQSFWEYKGE